MDIAAKLNRLIGKLIHDKELIVNGDKILIGLSGGKDSWTLCYFLKEFRKKAPIDFEIHVCTLDVHFSNEQKDILQHAVDDLGLVYSIYDNAIIEVIREKRREGSSYCSFCARLRRAYLYEAAQKFGCNKVALGHHLDDAIETYVMNIFYQGRTKGLPAKIKATNVEGIELIRPLLLCKEKDIIKFVNQTKLPIIKCNCDGTVKTDVRRKYVKSFLDDLEKDTEGVKQTILTSMQNVVANHIF
jgi:tRNA 2-thiocytidine biosynthesis protein TtcA